ncbi:MAG: radical SAM protein [candidate division Zixibacteria bacterium]|nr:radical SAM protein [candidate division Zixibacteria bacterium]
MKKNASHIIETGDELLNHLDSCDLCPQECGVDRTAGMTGECQAGDMVRVASCNLHFGEEPPISGIRGSGTIFFSGCSLSCLYCQNFPISQQSVGSNMTIEELSRKMLALEKRGAHNINLVTPDHFFGHAIKAIGLAVRDGMEIPIVCNSSGFQKKEIIERLEGIVDIYLVDMRYSDDEIARNCSGAKRYKEVNRAAIREMYRQVGNLRLNSDGIGLGGILVRHLVLPGFCSGSGEIFKFLAEEISKDVYVSLMSQYFPAYKAKNSKGFDRKITSGEFDKTIEMFYNVGLSNGYIQEMR